MAEQVLNYQVDRRYRVTFEKAAGIKTGDGFKTEVNGDDLDQVQLQAEALYQWAKNTTEPVPEEGK